MILRLEHVRGFEHHDPARQDRDFHPRLGIAANSLSLRPHDEGAKPRKLDGFSAFCGVGDFIEHRLDKLGGFRPGQAHPLVYDLRQIRPRHRFPRFAIAFRVCHLKPQNDGAPKLTPPKTLMSLAGCGTLLHACFGLYFLQRQAHRREEHRLVSRMSASRPRPKAFPIARCLASAKGSGSTSEDLRSINLSAEDHELNERIVLVTGASRGVGRAAALAFARAGAHVVALARTQGALEELDDEIRAIRPNEREPGNARSDGPARHAAIDRLGEALYRRWGRLDALVGNAGTLGILSPLHHVDPKEWENVLAVNVTANWRLIRSLDPLLRRSTAGRVVFVTSGVASRADFRAYWGPYAMSKAALDAIARTYAAETVNTSNIRVMLVNPGPLRTSMRAKAMPGEDPMTLRTPDELAPKLVEICSPAWTETGKLYDFPTDRILAFRAPD